VGLEIIRTAGGERGKTHKEEEKKNNKKMIHKREWKKPIEDARIFDSEW
jgi:hypothetical protein